MGLSKPLFIIIFFIVFFSNSAESQLRRNFYEDICPDVENIVRRVVTQKFEETFVTVPATLRMFFHDCFVQGCDASVLVASSPGNTAEKDNEDNLSLAGDGFDTVIRAKREIDSDESCRNRVSCADILTMAARDVVSLAGGPSYAVELGRFDGLRSDAADVDGNLPKPTFNLNQLNSLFTRKGLDQNDMIALSGAHTLGFSHCEKLSNRIYNFTRRNPVDPTLNREYATQLQAACPLDVDPDIAIDMDPTSPRTFDNAYFLNLQTGRGLFTSDQVLYTDKRSRSTVNAWARSSRAFNTAFIRAMTKLGRVGVKTIANGNIRFDCGQFN